MAGSEVRSTVLTVGLVALVLIGLYMVDPTLCGLVRRVDGFAEGPTMGATGTAASGPMDSGSQQMAMGDHSAGGDKKPSAGAMASPPIPPMVAQLANTLAAAGADASGNKAGFLAKMESFANMEDVTGPAQFGAAAAPAGCYPRDQLTPTELLPKDGNSVWAQQNPMGTGSLKGKNFLSAGALIGVNTVGQTLRNANYQLRSEPANPQVPVSVFYNSTIEPDVNRRDLEIE